MSVLSCRSPRLGRRLAALLLAATLQPLLHAAGCDTGNCSVTPTAAADTAVNAVALRAAVRGNHREAAAVRELLQQNPTACTRQLERYCQQPGVSCGRAITEACTSLAAQRDGCERQTLAFCRQQRLRDCAPLIKGQCSGAGSLEQIVARHDLSPEQEARLRRLALELGSKERGPVTEAMATLAKILGL